VRPVHALAVVFYILFGVTAGLGAIFYIGVAAVAAILIYEAWLLRTGDLSRIDLAFFNLNGYVSVLFAVAATVDILLRGVGRTPFSP
jgi:4-hydroxybenzoate polyprenyltransferase